MSPLDTLIGLVERGKLAAISVQTGIEDELLLVFPCGTKLKVQASYQYDEGGRAYLSINGQELPDGTNLSVGQL